MYKYLQQFILIPIILCMVSYNVFAADSKVSALAELAVTPADTDELYINDGGTSKKIQYSNVMSGEAATATALSVDPDNCTANHYPLGIDASGAVESCTADANTTYISSDFTLSDIGGSVTDAQVPNDITITESDPNALLTAGTDNVKDTHIDFGTGATQVSTADVTEQTNLYYTEARVSANTNVSTNSGKVTESTTVSVPLVKTTYALSIPVATSIADGYLDKDDWSTFNGKSDTVGTVTSVTGTTPIVSSGGATPAISVTVAKDLVTTSPLTGSTDNVLLGADSDLTIGITVAKDLVTTAPLTGGTDNILTGADADITIAIPLATTSVDGYLSQTDWDTFNGKAPTTSPTFATSITGSYLTASELLATDASKNIVSLAVATYPSLTELSYVKGLSSAVQTQLDAEKHQLCFVIDGGGSAVTTGAKAWVRATNSFTVGGAEITSETSTSSVVDIWVEQYADYPPADADSICDAGTCPTLTTAVKAQDTTLTSWTKTITAGDYIRANVDSNDNATLLEVCIYE